jgi:hypothetical protein
MFFDEEHDDEAANTAPNGSNKWSADACAYDCEREVQTDGSEVLTPAAPLCKAGLDRFSTRMPQEDRGVIRSLITHREVGMPRKMRAGGRLWCRA